jgi:hypothetical protein
MQMLRSRKLGKLTAVENDIMYKGYPNIKIR